jgi:hypothetical protein
VAFEKVDLDEVWRYLGMIQDGDGNCEHMVDQLRLQVGEAAEVLSRKKISLAGAIYLSNVVIMPSAMCRLKLSSARTVCSEVPVDDTERLRAELEGIGIGFEDVEQQAARFQRLAADPCVGLIGFSDGSLSGDGNNGGYSWMVAVVENRTILKGGVLAGGDGVALASDNNAVMRVCKAGERSGSDLGAGGSGNGAGGGEMEYDGRVAGIGASAGKEGDMGRSRQIGGGGKRGVLM